MRAAMAWYVPLLPSLLPHDTSESLSVLHCVRSDDDKASAAADLEGSEIIIDCDVAT